MTKQELIEKTNAYNNSIEGINFKNSASSGIKSDLNKLTSEWNTDHGKEVIASINKQFTVLETALNDIETAVQSIKGSKITTTFTTSSSTREV